MGQTYCNNCCVNQKLASFQNEIQTFAKLNDHTPLQTFAVKVKQTIELSSAVKEIYQTYRKEHFAERTGVKFDVHYLFNYAAYYDGEWKNGLPHGQGKLIYDDGSMYEGCFKQGYADCQQAIYIYRTGAFYRGEVKSNKANGQGELSTHKFYYKGRWTNDLPHGKGREIYGTNTYFQGQFVQGKKEGLGIYYWNSKEYYSGNFANNFMDGKGELILNDYTYRGSFQKGVKQGLGVIVNHKNNWKYEGEFRNNQMNGIGKYFWDDGTVFQGRFENDEKTNDGVMVLKNGDVVDCRILGDI